MWRCANCGAKNQSSAVCVVCGRPIDEALNAICRKVQGVRLRGEASQRWMRRGAKTGFIVGSALSLISVSSVLVVGLFEHRSLTELSEVLGVMVPFVLAVALLSALLFAAIFVVIGAVKPIWIALFCSIERFEQEYGSTKQ